MHGVKRTKRKEVVGDLAQRQEPTRTGPTSAGVAPRAVHKGADNEQQQRIAVRAAKAMDQQINRRRNRRSLFVWGDGKKATIMRYPDGTIEIAVPQTLTRDQEQYQFPPRSRLLKKLASVEPWPGSSVGFDDTSHSPQPFHHNDAVSAHHPCCTVAPPTPPPAPFTHKPDCDGINQWFIEKQHTPNHRKRPSILDWVNAVETIISPPCSPKMNTCSNAPAVSFGGQVVEGRRHADRGSVGDKPRTRSVRSELAPPPEHNRKHTVPQRYLLKAQPWHRQQPTCQPAQDVPRVSRIHDRVSSLQKSLQAQQQSAQGRVKQLETLLHVEHQRKHQIQRRQYDLRDTNNESLVPGHKPPSQCIRSVNQAVNAKHPQPLQMEARLKQSATQDGAVQQDLCKAVSTAVYHMNTLQQTISKYSQMSRTERQPLQTMLDRTLSEIRSLRKTRASHHAKPTS